MVKYVWGTLCQSAELTYHKGEMDPQVLQGRVSLIPLPLSQENQTQGTSRNHHLHKKCRDGQTLLSPFVGTKHQIRRCLHP